MTTYKLRPYVALIRQDQPGDSYLLKVAIPDLRLEVSPPTSPATFDNLLVVDFKEDSGGSNEVVKFEVKLRKVTSASTTSWEESKLVTKPQNGSNNQRVLVTLKLFNDQSGEYEDCTETKYRFIDHIKDSELFGDLHPYISYLRDKNSGGTPYLLHAITPAGPEYSYGGMEEDSNDPGNYLIKMVKPPVGSGVNYPGGEISVSQSDSTKVVSITVLEIEDGVPKGKRGKAKVSGATSSEIPNERKH